VLGAADAIVPYYQACPASESWTRRFCAPPGYHMANHNCCHYVDAALTVGSWFRGSGFGV
jgi:hypothetical protein